MAPHVLIGKPAVVGICVAEYHKSQLREIHRCSRGREQKGVRASSRAWGLASEKRSSRRLLRDPADRSNHFVAFDYDAKVSASLSVAGRRGVGACPWCRARVSARTCGCAGWAGRATCGSAVCGSLWRRSVLAGGLRRRRASAPPVVCAVWWREEARGHGRPDATRCVDEPTVGKGRRGSARVGKGGGGGRRGVARIGKRVGNGRQGLVGVGEGVGMVGNGRQCLTRVGEGVGKGPGEDVGKVNEGRHELAWLFPFSPIPPSTPPSLGARRAENETRIEGGCGWGGVGSGGSSSSGVASPTAAGCRDTLGDDAGDKAAQARSKLYPSALSEGGGDVLIVKAGRPPADAHRARGGMFRKKQQRGKGRRSVFVYELVRAPAAVGGGDQGGHKLPRARTAGASENDSAGFQGLEGAEGFTEGSAEGARGKARGWQQRSLDRSDTHSDIADVDEWRKEMEKYLAEKEPRASHDSSQKHLQKEQQPTREERGTGGLRGEQHERENGNWGLRDNDDDSLGASGRSCNAYGDCDEGNYS
ncbi:unnamed protein product [Closterium sp. NIES-54]